MVGMKVLKSPRSTASCDRFVLRKEQPLLAQAFCLAFKRAPSHLSIRLDDDLLMRVANKAIVARRSLVGRWRSWCKAAAESNPVAAARLLPRHGRSQVRKLAESLAA